MLIQIRNRFESFVTGKLKAMRSAVVNTYVRDVSISFRLPNFFQHFCKPHSSTCLKNHAPSVDTPTISSCGKP
eukprot:g5305.t1